MARAAKYIVLLGCVLTVVAAVAGWVATYRWGVGAMRASALAATVVWLVGSLSLLVLASAKTPAGRLNSALVAIVLRMSLPLAALVYFSLSQHSLAEQGIGPLIVVHYLAGLAIETWMSVQIAAAEPRLLSAESI